MANNSWDKLKKLQNRLNDTSQLGMVKSTERAISSSLIGGYYNLANQAVNLLTSEISSLTNNGRIMTEGERRGLLGEVRDEYSKLVYGVTGEDGNAVPMDDVQLMCDILGLVPGVNQLASAGISVAMKPAAKLLAKGAAVAATKWTRVAGSAVNHLKFERAWGDAVIKTGENLDRTLGDLIERSDGVFVRAYDGLSKLNKYHPELAQELLKYDSAEAIRIGNLLSDYGDDLIESMKTPRMQNFAEKNSARSAAYTGMLTGTSHVENALQGSNIGMAPPVVAKTFDNLSYTPMEFIQPTLMVRNFGGEAGELGGFWGGLANTTREEAFHSYALLPKAWGVSAERTAVYQFNPGVKGWWGPIQSQVDTDGVLYEGTTWQFVLYVPPGWSPRDWVEQLVRDGMIVPVAVFNK